MQNMKDITTLNTCSPEAICPSCREAGKAEGERIRQQAVEEVEQLKQKVSCLVTVHVWLLYICPSCCMLTYCIGSEHASLLHSSSNIVSLVVRLASCHIMPRALFTFANDYEVS